MKSLGTFFLLAFALAGCGVPLHHYANLNNGDSKQLNFDGVPAEAAIGVPVSLKVSHALEGTFECSESFQFELLSDDWFHNNCRFIDTPQPMRVVLSADCADACDLRLNGDQVILTPRAAGPTVLTVVGLMDDGTTRTDTVALKFSSYEPLRFECAQAFNCPGTHAVFAGASFAWRVLSMASATKPSRYHKVEVTEDSPTGVVALESGGINFKLVTIRALKPGIATLRFHEKSLGRDYEMTRQVRVVGLDEAVRGEARLRAGAVQSDGYVLADAEVVGDAVLAVVATESPQFILTWHLADGSLAVGGAGRVTASRGEVIALTRTPLDHWVEPETAPLPDDLDHMIFYFNGTPGPATLTAHLGSATFELSFDYRYEPLLLPLCSEPAKNPSDVTARGDDVDRWCWPTVGTIKVLGSQVVAFNLEYFPTDVVLHQVCGPAWAITGPQTNDFSVRFPTPGQYQFEKRTWAGTVVGERIEVQSVP